MDLPAILNRLRVGVIEVTLDGRLRAANESFWRLVERSPDGPISEWHLRDLIHPADAPTVERALEHGGGAEVRVMTPDRRAIWVQMTAVPGGDPGSAQVVLGVTDITARKQAEARANDTERRFREVADAAPVFIWTSGTDRQRRHTWVNTRWAEFCGRPIEAELGSGWLRGVHPDDVAGCQHAYFSAFDARAAFKAEYRLRRHDGEYRWFLDTGTPMHDEHGRFLGYIGSSVDITERKAIEREREATLAGERTARSDAERANQLKDEFLSILSHELRTPLNAVLGWVHLLRTSLGSEGQLGRGLNVIERNTRLQSRMVDDLLDMSGVIAGKMRLELRPVMLPPIIDGAIESLQPAFLAKGVMLRRRLVDDPGEVEGDPQRLHQIVWNLVSNSLKFTPAGGEVVVELSRAGDQASIVVRDTGQGIAPEFLPFVFDRFRQGDPSTRRWHGGLGIGLALVRSLSELHGGRTSAASEGPGRGSTFTVMLPRLKRRPISGLAHGAPAQSLQAVEPEGRLL